MTGERESRIWARLGSLWLAAMTAWYAWTAIGSIRHPLNAGSDRGWALAILGYCVAAAAWYLLFRKRAAAILWNAALAAASVAMVLASGQLVPALSCAWILALAGAVGNRLLRGFGAAPEGRALEWAALALPSGVVVLALLALGLSVAGLLTRGWILAVLLVLTLLEGRTLWRWAAALPEFVDGSDAPPIARWLLALCGFVAVVNLAWALSPEIHYDALNYHLAVPKAFLERHRAVDLPHFWHSYFAQMMESLFAIFLAVGGPIAAKLVSFAFGIAAALAVAAIGRFLFGETVGLWAGALFFATPMTAWLSSTAYTDLAAALFLGSAFLAFLRWRRARENAWLLATGWLAGGALAVKASAIYGLAVILIVLVFDSTRKTAGSTRIRLARLAGFAAAAAVAALPWYALRFAFTGNPFYPLWNALFPGARPVPADFAAQTVVGEGYGRTGGLATLFQGPFQLTFQSDRFGEPFPAGAMGIALAIVVPAGLLLLIRRRERAGLPLAVCAGYLAAWGLSFRGLRHGYPVLAVAAVLAIAAVDDWSEDPPWRRFHSGLLALAVVCQSALVPVSFWNIPERVPLRRAAGRESERDFLSRALRSYPAVEYLNRVVEPGEKVLGVAAANLRFYLKPRVDTVGETWELQRAVAPLHGAALAGRLAEMGYRRLFLAGIQPEVSPGYPMIAPAFLAEHATLEFQGGEGRVYALKR